MSQQPTPPNSSTPTTSDAAPAAVAWRGAACDMAAIALVSAAAMAAISRYLDNSVVITGNGIWKSRMVRRWMEGPCPEIDFPNVLYFPFYGLTLRLLPVKPDDLLWSWMAVINIGWAVVALVSLYALIRAMGLGRGPGIAGAAIQLGCAFFIGLAVTSEDIMPGHALTVLAMALTVRAIADQSSRWWRSTLLAATAFNLCWLFEWRLMFPLAPAIGLAYLAAPMPVRQRGLRLAVFMAMALALVAFVAILITVAYQQRPTMALEVAINMLWTGKGVGTGWAGWRLDKFTLLFIGTTQYLLGGNNVLTIAWLSEHSYLAWCFTAAVIMAGLLAVLGRGLARHWGQPRWRAAGIILLGNLVAGTVFNLYSQPQDPQMQIHVMVWVPVAAAVALELCRGRMAASGRWVALAGMAAGAALLGVNVFGTGGFAQRRGLDTRCLNGVAAIRQHTDIESTLFLFYGFELALPVVQAQENATEGWGPDVALDARRFKYVALTDQATAYNLRSAEESAKAVLAVLIQARRRGLRILASREALWDVERLVREFQTISDDRKPRALYAAIHDHFENAFAFNAGEFGDFFELQPRVPPWTPATAPATAPAAPEARQTGAGLP